MPIYLLEFVYSNSSDVAGLALNGPEVQHFEYLDFREQGNFFACISGVPSQVYLVDTILIILLVHFV